MRFTLLFGALVLLLCACDDRSDDDRSAVTMPSATRAESSATPPSSPAAETLTSTAGAVGPEVNMIAQGVLARDAVRVAALIDYTPLICTPQPVGAGAPPLCSSAGVPPRTTVETMPFLGCEGEYHLRPRAAEFIVAQAERLDPRAFFIFRPARHPFAFPSADRPWPRPNYTIVLKGDARMNQDFGVHVLNGRIIALQSFGICGGMLPAPDDPAWVTPPLR